MKLVSGKLMGEIDRFTIEDMGIPGVVLMENAGKGAFDKFILKYNPTKDSNMLIVCGKGNNGGDGFVIARWLKNYDFTNFKVVLLTDSRNLKGDAKVNFEICTKLGIKIFETDVFDKFLEITKNIKFDFIFDAVLGTGLNSEVRDFYKNIINFINDSGATVVSVDIPSGLHSEKGIPLGTAVKADITYTFGMKKIGMSTYPGVNYSKEVEVVNISIPKSIPFAINHFEIDDDIIKSIYNERPVHGHKGTFGHVAVLGGSLGFTGASVLAGKAALKTGCGLVTLIVPKEINNVVESLFIEGMTYPVDFNSFDKEELINFINDKSCLVLGPGIGTNETIKDLVCFILENIDIPVIIDADGINIVAEELSILKRIKNNVILTPHPGEMGRLTKKRKKDIQNSRIETVRDFIKDYDNVTLILKGYRTVIGNNDKIFICPKGDSSIATAGSGDVLSGIIGSFVAQGYSEIDASVMGVFFHGFAGEIASEKTSSESVIATDIMENFHYAMKITLF